MVDISEHEFNEIGDRVENDDMDDVSSENSLENDKRSSTYEDIVKDKQNYIANGITADKLQIFFNSVINGDNSNGAFNIQENGTFRPSPAADHESYDLSDNEQFIKFVEIHGGDEYFANAVVLCVFDYVLINDLQILKSKLQEYLPPKVDKEGKEVVAHQGLYLSISSILAVIQGKSFTMNGEERCVGLGEARNTSLIYLIEQFPFIREYIAKWLINIETFKYRTSFDAAQIVKAFVNIIELDFKWGEEQLIARLYSNSKHDWLLGKIAIELYNNDICKNKMLPILDKWSSSDGTWLWRPACLVYSHIGGAVEDDNFNRNIKMSLKKRMLGFQKSDIQYLCMLSIDSIPMRTLLINILSEMVYTCSLSEKRDIAYIYVLCIKYSNYFISKNMTVLPFVVCDNKNQHINLMKIIEVLLSQYPIKCLWSSVIKSYLKEISYYKVNQITIKRICIYFGIIMKNNPRYRQDIIRLLNSCNCDISNLVLSYCSEHKL